MRLFIQRVTEGRVQVQSQVVGAIGPGFVVLVGFGPHDDLALPSSRTWIGMRDKLVSLRVFPDADGKMNLGLEDFEGELLLVPQFTLYADCRKGRRPSFHLATAPDIAQALYERFVGDMEARLPGKVQQGVFGGDMRVSLVNWGPVTILLDSDELFPKDSLV